MVDALRPCPAINVVLEKCDFAPENFEVDNVRRLLEWVNDTVRTNNSNLNLMISFYHRTIEDNKPNLADQQSESKDPNIDEKVPMEMLIQQHFQRHVLFLMWFKKFFEKNYEFSNSDNPESAEPCEAKPQDTTAIAGGTRKLRSKAPLIAKMEKPSYIIYLRKMMRKLRAQKLAWKSKNRASLKENQS